MLKRYLFTTLICAGVPLMSHAADTSMFPSPEEGEQAHVIQLPHKANEQDLKVEVTPGKMLEVDCNHQRLGGEISPHSVKGWGYDYYRVSDLSGPVSTLMACPESDRHKAFVSAPNASLTLRYNSKLPIVVYTPRDVEVRYRIWHAEPEWSTASIAHPDKGNNE